MLGQALPYDSLTQLRRAMYEGHPDLARLDTVVPAGADAVARLADLGGECDKAPFASPVRDFYFTNPIARASKVMAELSELAARRRRGEATGTHG